MNQRVVDSEGSTVGDLTAWLTRSEVANELGVSQSTVRNYERKKVLNPVLDSEGCHRFNPDEVETVRGMLGEGHSERRSERRLAQVATANTLDVAAHLQAGAARSELGLARSIANSFIVPRGQLDVQLFKTIDKLQARVDYLEAQLEGAWKAREAAADRTHERQVHTKTIELQEKRTEMIIQRGLSALERFIRGNQGTPFLTTLSIEQLEAFIELRDVWEPAQHKALKEVLDQKRRETLSVVSNETEVKNGTESGK